MNVLRSTICVLALVWTASSHAQPQILAQFAAHTEANRATMNKKVMDLNSPFMLSELKFSDAPEKSLFFFLIELASMDQAALAKFGYSRAIDLNSKYYSLSAGLSFGQGVDSISTTSIVRILRVEQNTGRVYWQTESGEDEVLSVDSRSKALGTYTLIRMGMGLTSLRYGDIFKSWAEGAREHIPDYLESSPLTGRPRIQKSNDSVKDEKCEEPLAPRKSGFFEAMKNFFGG